MTKAGDSKVDKYKKFLKRCLFFKGLFSMSQEFSIKGKFKFTINVNFIINIAIVLLNTIKASVMVMKTA